ncbi:hypothetical protein N8Z86_03060 [Amylibacter sp.]|nr:hypothetical protein [Amylibacter sp.]
MTNKSADEKVVSPELNNNRPPYCSRELNSALKAYSYSLPLITIDGRKRVIRSVICSSIRNASSTSILLLTPSRRRFSAI